MIRTIAEFSTWAGLIPLGACAFVWLRKWSVPPNAVLLSLGFGVSFLADLTAKTLVSQGYDTWFISFLWPPVQLAVWWAVIAQRESVRWTGSLGILVAGALSLASALTMADTRHLGLELVVRCLGSLAVIVLAWKSVGFARYRVPILLTGLGMIVFALPLATIPPTMPLWLGFWGGFQAVRLVALVLMARAILFPRTLEVVDGRGPVAQARGESRAVGGVVRGARRSPLAQA